MILFRMAGGGVLLGVAATGCVQALGSFDYADSGGAASSASSSTTTSGASSSSASASSSASGGGSSSSSASASSTSSASSGTSSTSSGSSSGSASSSCGSLSVNGTDTQTFLTTGARTVVKPNLSGAAISAQAGPAFATFTATGTVNGAFQLADLPSCDYYLSFADPGVIQKSTPPVFLTSSASPDMSRSVTGRSTVVAMTSATPVTVNLTGLDPWVTTDSLMLTAPGANVAPVDLEGAAHISLATNAVAYLQTFDASHAFQAPNLIDSGLNDHVFVLQYENQTQGALTCTVVAKDANITGVTMTNGQATTITGALTATPQMKSLTVDWAATQFASLAPDVGAGATLGNNFVNVTAHMGTPSDGGALVQPTLLSFSPKTGSDVNVTVKFGDPFAGAFAYYVVEAYTNYAVSVAAPSATPLSFYVGVGYLADLPTFQMQTPLVPLLTPVKNLMVDGQTSGALKSPTPTITFSAPTTGTASRYEVRIYQLTKTAQGATTSNEVADLQTSFTSIPIPSGMLTTGSTYAFMVMATAYPGATIDPNATPRRSPFPQAYAQALTGAFTVQ